MIFGLIFVFFMFLNVVVVCNFSHFIDYKYDFMYTTSFINLKLTYKNTVRI
jgi:hypothetical protein